MDYRIEIRAMDGGCDYAWKLFFRGEMIAAGTDPMRVGAEFVAEGARSMHEETNAKK